MEDKNETVKFEDTEEQEKQIITQEETEDEKEEAQT